MEIDMESEGRDINPPHLEAKINQASFNGQRDYWATKSYFLKYIIKPGTSQHYPGYGKGQIEVPEVIQRHAICETISIADWRKVSKELDTDRKVDTVKLQSPVSCTEDQERDTDRMMGHTREEITGNFQPRYNTRDDFRSQGRGQRGGIGDYRGRGYRGNRDGRNRDSRATDTYYNGNNHNLFNVAPCPPVESVPATTSNTVVPDLTQRQICGPTPQLVRTPDSWKSNKTSTPNYQSKQPTSTQDPPDSWASIATQPLSLELKAQHGAQRLHDQRILQENRARNEYRIHMQQRAQNKAQKYLMDGMLKNLEARSKGFDNRSYNPFGNFQPYFNPNLYIDKLSQIPSQDQQEYYNDFDQYQMQRDEDHDSNDDVFGDADLIELQVRGRRKRGKKNRGRGKAQSQAQPLLSSHQPIQESTQSKLRVPGRRRGKTGAANGTINPSAQSSGIKQIADGSDFNFGSSMDIDMKQMMEWDLTQTQRTTNDCPK
ncbi:MAG: hypothetical protein EZS28_032932 [Streblomastix strix]|uniref:Uncharacterized protein n=1 Tax=Streblomastix strix TaxID=222440 RepID=A0A5J4UN83_9EUKA|nr:MAG: hypothetical protein EZS28_032932 [Streblomastix strix]